MVSDEELLRRRRRSLSPSYRLFYERPVHLVRGEGAWLFDAEGRRYLDCYNNVASVGHCHPHVVEALCRQAATLNTHTRYLHETVVRYAERLTGTLPDGLEVCMFVCTGTEANDLAVRIARAATGNSGIIVTQNAYHGNSATVFGMSTEARSVRRANGRTASKPWRRPAPIAAALPTMTTPRCSASPVRSMTPSRRWPGGATDRRCSSATRSSVPTAF
jgi:4-aminobutyrate aminotransferase-like enzyme